MRKNLKWHKFIYKFCRAVPAPVIAKMFGYKCIRSNIQFPEGPFILVSNHSTDLDPIWLGLTVKPHMYFVASEHIFTKGFLTKILKFFFDPIPIRKGGSDLSSVLEIKRRLKAGCSVAVFPEGGRNFTGKTEKIKPSTGKLIKTFGSNLVTFRFSGGYLTSPRWSQKTKKGKFIGETVNVYTAEDLKNKTPEEINEIITRDISENDYAYQAENNILYKGKKKAESIEKSFFICPECGKISTVRSKNDTVFCLSCDFKAEYGEDGHLHGENIPFDTLDVWDEYQINMLRQYTDNASSDYNEFSDDNLIFSQTTEAGRRKRLGRCSIKMDSDNLTVTFANPLNTEVKSEPRVFPVETVMGMSQCGKKILVFSSKGEKYELKGNALSFRKYEELFKILKEKEGK